MRTSRKILLVTVLAAVLVLSFASIATAKYAGAIRSGNGYATWDQANEIWADYTDQAAGSTQSSAHGGYITSSTKCVVCHASHRAYAANQTVPGVTPAVNQSLTAGSTCVNCHTSWSAGGSTKKIEWAQTDPGPHGGFECTGKCHSGGVHATSSSAYHGMNAYMLGGTKDGLLDDAFARGNYNSAISYNGGTTDGAGWFQNGTTSTSSDMKPPAGVNANQFSAAKAMATGYTCAQTGCHVNGQFATNVWGFASNRANPGSSSLNTPMTGHLTTFPRNYGLQYPQCGPCHPGAPAGGYRAIDSTEFDESANGSARAYGCDQCHDVVGVLTNTTAWPHGNRGIDAWQWTATDPADPSVVERTSLSLDGGNLWMYQANLITDGNLDPDTGQPIRTFNPADGTFTVIEDAVGSSSTLGNINDGTCLKCHMGTDQASIAGMGIDPADGATIATDHQHALFVNGSGQMIDTQTPGGPSVFTPDTSKDYTGTSYQIFLWK